ncbi:MAG: hypothetical protein BJ554DRAFT_2931, partial [Olpidium bornovanus]
GDDSYGKARSLRQKKITGSSGNKQIGCGGGKPELGGGQRPGRPVQPQPSRCHQLRYVAETPTRFKRSGENAWMSGGTRRPARKKYSWAVATAADIRTGASSLRHMARTATVSRRPPGTPGTPGVAAGHTGRRRRAHRAHLAPPGTPGAAAGPPGAVANHTRRGPVGQGT